MKEKGILDNWSIIQVPWVDENADAFTPPEAMQGSRPAIQGQPRGDEEMVRRNLYIITSRPIKIETFYDQARVITQSGSVYVLGKIDPEYHRLYPDALERLKKTLE